MGIPNGFLLGIPMTPDEGAGAPGGAAEAAPAPDSKITPPPLRRGQYHQMPRDTCRSE
ncbi:hypothetical protein GCM10010376_51210 [Streptomyces violaceusniger]